MHSLKQLGNERLFIFQLMRNSALVAKVFLPRQLA